MGGDVSRNKSPKITVPQYPLPYNTPPYTIVPPTTSYSTYPTNFSNLSKKEVKQLNEAYRTIQNFQSRMYPSMRPVGATRPLTPPPTPPPIPSYPGPPIMNVSQPPSPRLQRPYGQYPPSFPSMPGGIRDTDFAAVANISGLNAADVALLHREYMNLTRGGKSKIDRVVFRQILRDVLLEANNENIDRALENIFVSIDRNRDGFIDFPEFVGAFRDILKTESLDAAYSGPPPTLSEILNQRTGTNVASSLIYQPPLALPTPQVISVPSVDVQQQPIAYNSAAPLMISLDPNQSQYVPTTQYQSILQQSPSLQCIPLSM